MIEAFLSLTFDLQDQSHTVNLVPVLHSHGVVAAVLLLGPNQGENAHVAAHKARMCSPQHPNDRPGELNWNAELVINSHLVSLSCRRLV